MRKKMKHTSFIIAGAATLFVGIAGNLQAVTIPMQSNGNTDTRSWVLATDAHGNKSILGQNLNGGEIAYPVNQGGLDQISASLNAALSKAVSAQNAAAHNNPGLPGVSHGSQGAPPMTILPVSPSPVTIIQGAPPLVPVPVVKISDSISVPDGGMTIVLLGGVFCGFVIVRKNLKPVQVI